MDELKSVKDESKSLKNEQRWLHKDVRRRRSFHCLYAAHNLFMAEIHSRDTQKTSLQDAEKTSALINIFIDDINEKTTPYQFMNSPEEEANKAIESFEIYRMLINAWPEYKRVIEGFSRWYIGSNAETAMIKCNYPYIEHIATILLLKDSNRINDKEYCEMINSFKNYKHPFFDYHPELIKRSFVQVMQKVDEITRKIEKRSKPNSVLKVVTKKE